MKTEGEAETFFPYICHRDLFSQNKVWKWMGNNPLLKNMSSQNYVCVSANILNIYIYTSMS